MNGREIEHMLTLIDANIEANQTAVRSEMYRFISEHQDQVLSQLRASKTADIPTSSGMITVKLTDLQQLIA